MFFAGWTESELLLLSGGLAMKKLLFFAAILVAVQAASMHVPAVDAEGKGALTVIDVKAISGKGDVFVSVTPLTGANTQQSEKTAVKIAAEKAGVDAGKYDVLFRIKSDAEIVDGPSAGAAMTLLAYSEFSKKRLRTDLAISGTIERDGSVGKVGGIFEKTLAVAESKKFKVFLVPRGQAIQNGVDLREYGRRQGLQVVEVSKIDDAIKYATNTTEGSTLEVEEEILPPLKLEPFPATRKAEAFKKIAEEQIAEAAALFAGLKDKNTAVAVSVEDSLNTSRKLLDNGYSYSAANSAFLATIALEETSAFNWTREEFSRKFSELDVERDATSFAEPTMENAEWVAAAKMRWYWAGRRLEDARKKAGLLPTAFLVEDYALAKEWLGAAKKLNSIAEKIGGEKISELAFRETASRLLSEAEKLGDDDALTEEDADNLESAKQAFQNSDYLAAALNLEFVLAYSEANAETLDKTFKEIYDSICANASSLQDCLPQEALERESAWAELYEAHGYYYVQEANRTGQGEYAVNALKMLLLAERIEELFAEVSTAPITTEEPTTGAPSTPPPSQMQVSVTASVPAQNSARDIVLLLLAAIVVLIAILVFSVGRRVRAGRLDRQEDYAKKLDRLDDLLVEGKISERNYDRLMEKYSRLAGREEKEPRKGRKRK